MNETTQTMGRMLIEQNMSYAEIGAEFGISRQAVHQRMQKAGFTQGGQAQRRKAVLLARLTEAHRRIMSREATVAEEAERLGYKNGTSMRSTMLRNGMPIRLPRREPDHGTLARYQGLGCRCDLCRRANAERSAELQGREPPHHGTESGYQNYGCRCQPCKEARRMAVRARLVALRQRREIAA